VSCYRKAMLMETGNAILSPAHKLGFFCFL
jgi:hypothetical protein